MITFNRHLFITCTDQTELTQVITKLTKVNSMFQDYRDIQYYHQITIRWSKPRYVTGDRRGHCNKEYYMRDTNYKSGIYLTAKQFLTRKFE